MGPITVFRDLEGLENGKSICHSKMDDIKASNLELLRANCVATWNKSEDSEVPQEGAKEKKTLKAEEYNRKSD